MLASSPKRKSEGSETSSSKRKKGQGAGATGASSSQSHNDDASLKVGGTQSYGGDWTVYPVQRPCEEIINRMLTTTVNYIKPKNNLVLVAYRNDSVTSVLRGMLERNLYSVPVLLDSKGLADKFFGVLDLADVVTFACNLFHGLPGDNEEEFMSYYEKSAAWKGAKVNDIMETPRSTGTHVFQIPAGRSLLFAAEILAKEERVHVVPVLQKSGHPGHIHTFITSGRILNYLSGLTKEEMGSFGARQLRDIRLPGFVRVVEENVTAMRAFEGMKYHGVRGMGVVDADGKLVDCISTKDIAHMRMRSFWRLWKPVSEFLKSDTDKEYKPQRKRLVTASLSDTVFQTIHSMLNNNVHRVFIVDPEGKPSAVVTQKDIIFSIFE